MVPEPPELKKFAGPTAQGVSDLGLHGDGKSGAFTSSRGVCFARGTALHAVVVERCLAIMEPGILELLPKCFQIIPEPFGLGFLGFARIP